MEENPDLTQDQKVNIHRKLKKIVFKKISKLCESLFIYDKLRW